MQADEIIRMAREAGICAVKMADGFIVQGYVTEMMLDKFADVVDAAAREECAAICKRRGEEEVAKWQSLDPEYLDEAKACAWMAVQCEALIMKRSKNKVSAFTHAATLDSVQKLYLREGASPGRYTPQTRGRFLRRKARAHPLNTVCGGHESKIPP